MINLQRFDPKRIYQVVYFLAEFTLKLFTSSSGIRFDLVDDFD